MNQEPKYIIHATRVHTRFEHRSLVGYRPEEATLPVFEKIPCVRWTGGKIQVALWREILAFFKWSYDTTKSETQVRLFYNAKTREWRAHAFPQEKNSGLTTKELSDHPNREEDMKLFAGFEPWGTVHHHCGIGAFQSGTDKDDEVSQAGLHITVGYMDKPEHEIHSRVTVVLPGELNSTGECLRKAEKLFLEPDLMDWFALPPEVEANVPAALHLVVLKHYLISAAKPTESFPQRWKDNVIEVVRQLPNGPNGVRHVSGMAPLGVAYPQNLYLRGSSPAHQHELSLRAGSYGNMRSQGFTDEEIQQAWETYYGRD